MNSQKEEHLDSWRNSSSQKIFMIQKIKKFNFWSAEEDQLLLNLTTEPCPKNWLDIATYFKNKSPVQCSARYLKIKPGIKKGHWSNEEDRTIAQYVVKYGRKWSRIGKLMTNRTGKQIRDRYLNYIDRTTKRERFTSEEDDRIKELYIKYGTKWTKISKSLFGRTPEMIKNRFYSFLRSKIHVYEKRKSNQRRLRIVSRKKTRIYQDINEEMDQINLCEDSQFKEFISKNSKEQYEEYNSYYIQCAEQSFSIYCTINKFDMNDTIKKFFIKNDPIIKISDFPKFLENPFSVTKFANFYIENYEQLIKR
jgi:myb proto-oncogene protein